jgi:hypothetical protein
MAMTADSMIVATTNVISLVNDQRVASVLFNDN